MYAPVHACMRVYMRILVCMYASKWVNRGTGDKMQLRYTVNKPQSCISKEDAANWTVISANHHTLVSQAVLQLSQQALNAAHPDMCSSDASKVRKVGNLCAAVSYHKILFPQTSLCYLVWHSRLRTLSVCWPSCQDGMHIYIISTATCRLEAGGRERPIFSTATSAASPI